MYLQTSCRLDTQRRTNSQVHSRSCRLQLILESDCTPRDEFPKYNKLGDTLKRVPKGPAWRSLPSRAPAAQAIASSPLQIPAPSDTAGMLEIADIPVFLLDPSFDSVLFLEADAFLPDPHPYPWKWVTMTLWKTVMKHLIHDHPPISPI